MDENLNPATGETVEENVSPKDDGNEVHVTTLLLERAPWDLAVEAFLVRVFLSLPRHLKACRRVCTSWNSFIKEQVGLQLKSLIHHLYMYNINYFTLKVWRRPNVQRRLRRFLAKNWSLGVPIRQFEFQPPAATCLACDQELLVVGGAGEVMSL